MANSPASDRQDHNDHRRRFLQTIGAVGAVGLLAGCLGDDDSDADDPADATDDDDVADGDDEDAIDYFTVSDLDPSDWEPEAIHELEVSATIENPGDEQRGEYIKYRVDGEVLDDQFLPIEGGGSQQVTFTDISLAGFDAEETYEHGVYADNDAATGTVLIPSVGPPMPGPDTEYGIAYHPEAAAETIVAGDGWTVELVASEPLIEKPVDIKWDAAGRMWVCEMRDFMEYQPADWVEDDDLDLWDHVPWTDGDYSGGNYERTFSTEPTGEGGLYDPTHPVWGGEPGDRRNLDGWLEEWSNSHEPNGRIAVLEDTDSDGIYEEATYFLDDLTLPRAFGFVGGTANEIMVCQSANHRWYQDDDVFVAKDTDGDLEADEREGMIDNYTNEWDIEHTANGMHFMLDNWHWQCNAGDKFRYHNGEWESTSMSSIGQWGMGQDDWGRINAGNNRRWGYHNDVPGNGDYFHRGGDGSFGLSSSFGPDDNCYPIRPGYHTVRSYTGGYSMLRDDTTIDQPRGGAGAGSYRADIFPAEYRNNIYMTEPVSNTVARFQPNTLDEIDVSYEQIFYDPPSQDFFDQFDEIWDRYEAHPPYSDSAPDPSQFERGAAIDQREFIASVDEFFRPVNCKTGPDGALYIVDMYQNVIQNAWHVQQYITNYLGVQGGMRIPAGGRIYRVYPEGAELDDVPDFTEMEADEVAGHLDHENGWRRDTAKRVIVQDGLSEAADAVRDVAQDGDVDQGRVHALWTLHGIEEIDLESVETNLGHSNIHVITHAVRTGEQLLGTGDEDGYIDAVIDVATSTDNIRVAVQCAFSLGEVTGDRESDVEDAFDMLDAEWGGYVTDAINSSPNYSA